MLDSDFDQWSTSRLLLTATRLVENAWNKELAGIGITHAGLTVLIVITLQGAGTQAEIARSVRVQPQTMTRILDNLEYKGLVVRVQTSFAHKRQLFAITPAGSKVLTRNAETEQTILPQDMLSDRKLREYLKQTIDELARRHSHP